MPINEDELRLTWYPPLSEHGPAPPPEASFDLKSVMKAVTLSVIAAFIVSAVWTPETTGFANSTVQLPHEGELPASVTLTLAMESAPGVGVGVGVGGAVGVGTWVSVGVGATVSVGAVPGVGVTWTMGGLGDDPSGM
jgi:hypothetical protein